ncbi:SPX domain-containing protein [Mycena sanguinolenta]|uniref:SPX domain-containing protein n=1 Tax=Mycena sanguinolenta TaxID=230812 RepID=A0A8H7DNW2_9AGAR|nr:SPX domain-containing protein [Mycena sanguinolenta]
MGSALFMVQLLLPLYSISRIFILPFFFSSSPTSSIPPTLTPPPSDIDPSHARDIRVARRPPPTPPHSPKPSFTTPSCHGPCQHPADLRAHGAYLSHGAGPSPQRGLVPQSSHSVTPLHADIRVALQINWVPDGLPHEGRPPPLGLSWSERVDAHLQWRGSNTAIWYATDRRWRDAHCIRLAAPAAGVGSANVSVLDPGAPFDEAFGARWRGQRRSGGGVQGGGREIGWKSTLMMMR